MMKANAWRLTRGTLPIVALWFVLAGPVPAAPLKTAAEIAKLEGAELDRAMFEFLLEVPKRQAASAAADSWLLLDRLAMPPQNPALATQHALNYGYLAQAICRFGGRADFDRLLSMADQLPPDDSRRRHLIAALLEGAIRQRVEELVRANAPIKIRLPQQRGPLPPLLNNAAPELVSIWRTHQAIATGLDAAVERSTNGWIGAQSNWPLFFDTLSELLHGRATNASEQIVQFTWGGWCGTGMEQLEAPKKHALFLALLQEHRYERALAVLFRLSPHPGYTLPLLGDDGRWRREFIRLCGLDWEALYAGDLLARTPYDFTYAAQMLAQHGSERGARWLGLMADLGEISDQTAYLRALGAFCGPNQRLMETNADGTITMTTRWGNAGYARQSEAPIPAQQQAELMKILAHKLRPGVSLEVANTVSQILGELRRPEGKAALRFALELPYAGARKTAQEALQAMGESVPRLAALAPVGFRFLANGQPLKEAPVNFEVRMNAGRTTSSSRKTDSEGRLFLEHDLFVDAQHPVTNVVLAAGRLKQVDQPWFEVTLPAPANLTQILDVPVTLTSLTIAFTGSLSAEFLRDEQMRIVLRAQRNKSYGIYPEDVSEDVVIPFTPNLVFPSLQPGRYQVLVRIPGAALWQSGDIVLAQQPVEISARLERGADIRYAILPPGKNTHTALVPFQILQNGKPLELYLYQDWRTNICRSLPIGQYVLRVTSSADQRKRSREPNEIIPPAAGYRGLDTPFVINHQSPKLIDLGDLRLPREDGVNETR